MALKDVLKSLTGKKQDEVSCKNDAANAPWRVISFQSSRHRIWT